MCGKAGRDFTEYDTLTLLWVGQGTRIDPFAISCYIVNSHRYREKGNEDKLRRPNNLSQHAYLGRAFIMRIHTENRDQTLFTPSCLHEIILTPGPRAGPICHGLELNVLSTSHLLQFLSRRYCINADYICEGAQQTGWMAEAPDYSTQ